MKISDTKPFLNTALVFLLAFLTSPQSVTNVAAKDVFLSGTTLSTVAIQNNYLGNPEGDNPDIHRAHEWVNALPLPNLLTRLPTPVFEPDVAFTVSQARAPPQC